MAANDAPGGKIAPLKPKAAPQKPSGSPAVGSSVESGCLTTLFKTPVASTANTRTCCSLSSVAAARCGGNGIRALGREPAGRLTLGLGVGEATSLPLSAGVVTCRLAGGRVGVPITLAGLAGRFTCDGEDGMPGAAAAGSTPVLASRIPPANKLRPRLFRRV